MICWQLTRRATIIFSVGSVAGDNPNAGKDEDAAGEEGEAEGLGEEEGAEEDAGDGDKEGEHGEGAGGMALEEVSPDDEADAGDDGALVGDGEESRGGEGAEYRGLAEGGNEEEEGDRPSHLPDDGAGGGDALDEPPGVHLAHTKEEGGEDEEEVAEEGMGGETGGALPEGENNHAGEGERQAGEPGGIEGALHGGEEVTGEVGEDGVGVEDNDAEGGGGEGSAGIKQGDLSGKEDTEEKEGPGFGRGGTEGNAAAPRPNADDNDAKRHAPEGAPERGNAVDADADGDEVATPEDGDDNGEEDGAGRERFDRGGRRSQTIIVPQEGGTGRRCGVGRCIGGEWEAGQDCVAWRNRLL